MRKNKEIRKLVNENYKPIKGKLMLYALVYFLIPVAVGFIPFVGSALSSILSLICVIGFTATVVHVYNGQGENESPISFLTNSFKLFTNWICSSLWICLKCIVGIIIMIVGIIMLTVGGASALVAMNSDSYAALGAGLGIVAIIGFILYFVGIIITVILSLKYACVSYDIIHDDKSGKKAKGLVEESKAHLKGHIWQWLCMGLYYSALIFVMIFLCNLLLGFAIGFITNAIQNVIVVYLGMLLMYIPTIAILVYFFPKSICAYEELHKDITANN